MVDGENIRINKITTTQAYKLYEYYAKKFAKEENEEKRRKYWEMMESYETPDSSIENIHYIAKRDGELIEFQRIYDIKKRKPIKVIEKPFNSPFTIKELQERDDVIFFDEDIPEDELLKEWPQPKKFNLIFCPYCNEYFKPRRKNQENCPKKACKEKRRKEKRIQKG